ncbi:MAG: hypothetical protein ACYCZ6_15965 [Polaromonas sp.]
MDTGDLALPQSSPDSNVEITSRSGRACSADWQRRQAPRGGDGLDAGHLEGKQSAQASGMEAHRARHHVWLDAQHDSPTRHRRGTH